MKKFLLIVSSLALLMLLFGLIFLRQENEVVDTKALEINKSTANIKSEVNTTKLKKGLFADYDDSVEDTHLQDDFFTKEQEKAKEALKVLNEEKNQSLLEPKIKDVNLSSKAKDTNLSDDIKDINLSDRNLSSEKNTTSIDFNSSTIFNENKKNIYFKKDKQARLAIIIDDMSSKEQVKALKNTGLKLNPSFFPRDKNHPNTHNYAKEFDFFMVHLPLAALNFKNEEIQTLKPHQSQEEISAKIKSIKNDFKDLKFINNHTGSLFTSDANAMRKLFLALDNFDLIFVDSLTTNSSKVRTVARDFNKTYIKRDIFLDNYDDLNYIKKQIKKAVNLAKKNGFAIAIAHPKKNTFKALMQSKDVLNEVKLVYLSEIYGTY